MPLRRLLNVAHAAMTHGLDDDALAGFDEDLEVEPMVAAQRLKRKRRGPRRSSGDVAGLMAAASLPQAGRGG